MNAANVWSFDLQYPRPPKGLHANDRVHWRAKARSTEQVRQEVMLRVRSLRLGELDRVSVELVWVVGTKAKRDADNVWPLLKAVCDGIGSDRGTSARLVVDDDPAHMEKLAPIIHYIPGASPHFRVIIRDLGDEVTS